MECLAKMMFLALVFFWGGWQFRASKMEKKVLISFEGIQNSISDMSEELEFHRIERDNLMLQQKEVLSKLQNFNKKEKKEAEIDISAKDFNDKMNSIKNKNNGIKK